MFRLHAVYVMLHLVHFTFGQWTLNATGGSFPSTLYNEAAFSNLLIANGNFLIYAGEGSGCGQCNILGYWHTGNFEINAPQTSVKSVDQTYCTHLASTTLVQRQNRHPIVDIGATDTVPSSIMYQYYADMQLFPAIAGAIVPVYNIPELNNLFPQHPLILSRTTIASIFMGTILFWNDSRILADNTGVIKTALQSVTAPINLVTRQDSAGQSSIMATGMSMASASFAATIGTSSAPTWCDPLTDEVQTVAVSGCDSLLPHANKLVTLAVVTAAKLIKYVVFACDAAAADLQTALLSDGLTVTVVSKTFTSPSNTSWSYQIGYSDPNIVTKNWYQPIVLSKPVDCRVAISTLQEGGFLNNHVTGAQRIPLTQSIFMNSSMVNTTSTQAVFLNISLTMESSVWTTYLLPASSTDMSSRIMTALNLLVAGSTVVTSVTRYHNPLLPVSLVEYRVVMAGASTLSDLSVYTAAPNSLPGTELTSLCTDCVHVMKMTDLNNFPLFRDSVHVEGYSNSGRYTCFRRSMSYKPWSYYTGYEVTGVLSVTHSVQYSIGYGALQFAVATNIPRVSMINQAGNIVAASSTTVTHAVMELGGNFDSKLTSSLVDGKSSYAWPFASFTYFLLRMSDHLGSCERRKSAGMFLHNFYFSTSVAAIANSLGFATIPEFIRDTVVGKLQSSLKCSNGDLVFAPIVVSDLHIADDFVPVAQVYLNTFSGVNSSLTWNITHTDDSTLLWSQFVNDDISSIGAFTLFSSRAEKVSAYYGNHPNLQTTAFAHVAVVPIYHLNAFVAAGVKLVISSDVLAGIYCGEIKYWNDSMIQETNAANKHLLPHTRIRIVARSGASDTTSIFVRYLAIYSASFRSAYSVSSSFVRGNVNYAGVLDNSYLLLENSNLKVDLAVTYNEGSIGYFLHTSVPTSPVATFCRNNSCDHLIFTSRGVDSLAACANDLSTVVAGDSYSSFDLMLSSSVECYPITGTVDFTTFVGDSSMTNAYARVQFSSWLFSSGTISVPLQAQSIGGSSNDARVAMFVDVCDIQSSRQGNFDALGYTYCGYRDCTWESGDFYQLETSCDSKTATQTAYYVQKPSSNCLTNNPYHAIPKNVTFPCIFVPSSSSEGQAVYGVVGIAIIGCGFQTIFTFRITGLKTSLFKIISMIGGILMTIAAVVFLGPATDYSCLLRPWYFNISATLMFAPLLVKLNGVWSLSLKTLTKSQITNTRVAIQVLAMLTVDVVILSLWTALDKPAAVLSSAMYPNLLAPVPIVVCNTGLHSRFEVVMVIYKALLLVSAVVIAVLTWKVEISRLTAVVSYNIAVVGGGIYFLTFSLGHSNPGIAVLMRCLSIVICSSFAVAVILLPKLIRDAKIFADSSSGTGGKEGNSGTGHLHSGGADKSIVSVTTGNIRGSLQRSNSNLSSMHESAANWVDEASPQRRTSMLQIIAIEDEIESFGVSAVLDTSSMDNRKSVDAGLL